jgi:glycosyltransferase involved in cell wall biosynthesis
MGRSTAAAAWVAQGVVAEAHRAHPRASGKFFFRGAEKCFLRGVTYGPFAPGPHGGPFPEREIVRRDFALMRDLGVNCVRTFTPPPEWVLDLADDHDLGVLVGLPWTEHVCFLDEPAVIADIHAKVSAGVDACKRHAAVLAFLIGNEIPPDVVRWHRAEHMQGFLRGLYERVKAAAPDVLVSYANFPPTEYLDLDFLDFIAFNVYLHREPDFRRYLSRLQNLAKDKPLVLTEFGIDSLREGTLEQAQILSWQVRAAFESGVAGTVIFSWTDEWFTGGFRVEDWAFGLVDRERHKKPAYHAVQKVYSAPLPPALGHAPRISVVICAYNAERTMDACLASLRELRYPHYEVIVVNDGSTDRTLEIAQRYPEVRIISQENKGLSVARNVGIAHASGTIVAFTDSDCVVDPDWLTYLSYKFVHSGFAAVGGPNLPPPEDARIPACVAAAPGGPTHVLVDDEVAEHIPGCNMAFLKTALEEVGGFDPIHRTAGDDVDLCWRFQNHGHPIGFSPAALVWHFRRNTITAYLTQQMGYGRAEAQLYFKHPFRFNMLGQSQWIGRIYGDLGMSLFSHRPIIYHGVFGRGLFQTLYERPSSMLSYVPFTLEWNLAGVVLLIGALIAGRYALVASLPLCTAFVWAAARAWRAKVDPRYEGPGSRLLITLLIYLGPLLRSLQRYIYRIQGMTNVARIELEEIAQPARVRWLQRRFFLFYWSDSGLEKENLLHAVMEFLLPRKYLIAVDQGWGDCDLTVYRGIWSKVDVKVAVENHGGRKRFFRTRTRVRESVQSRIALLAFGALAVTGWLIGLTEIALLALLLGMISLGVIAYDNFRVGRIMYHVLEIVGKQIGLNAVNGGAD